MKLQILGSGSAEGYPAIFCGCEACLSSKRAGGKSLRSRASILIDDIYKVDLPPDTYYHVIRHNLDLSRLKYLFFTHFHPDHFAPAELSYLGPTFATNLANAPIEIYGSPGVISAIEARMEKHEIPVVLRTAEPYIPIEAGNLTFTPVIAKHSASEMCFNYVVQQRGTGILYACDTGPYEAETLAFLGRQKLDMIIIECTRALDMEPGQSHMGLGDVLRLRDRLAESGAVTSATRIVLTHISHRSGLLHEQFEDAVMPYGLEVGFDGWVAECPCPE